MNDGEGYRNLEVSDNNVDEASNNTDNCHEYVHNSGAECRAVFVNGALHCITSNLFSNISANFICKRFINQV